MRAGSDEVIPLCSDDSIVLAWCWIRAETEHGEECRLHYRDNGDFSSSCTSRFTLQTHNHTVSLHLSNLTPEDSGNHTCQCSFAVGIQHLHLQLTVTSDLDGITSGPTRLQNSFWLLFICVTLVVVVTWTLGFICWKRRIRRRNPKSAVSTTSFLHPQPDDLYQNTSKSVGIAPAAKAVGMDADVTPGCVIYENIQTKVKTGLGFISPDW